MGLGQVWRNIWSRGLKDVTDRKTIESFFDWQDIKKNGLTLSAEEIVAYSEQLVTRRALCYECVAAGECIHCHCDADGKMITPSSKCSAGKWGPMKSAAEHNKERKEIVVLG